MRWPVLVVVCHAGLAFADEPTPELPKDRLGGEALLVLPTDNYAVEARLGLGLLVHYERRVGSQLYLTARGGPVFHDSKLPAHSLAMVLALAGLRYNLDPDRSRGAFFSMALGVNVVHAKVSGPGIEASDTEPGFALDLGAGYQFGKLQVRTSVFYTPHVGASFEGDTNYLGFAVTLGYDFAVR